MPTVDDAIRVAQQYAATDQQRTGKAWRGFVQEFEHGWAIWTAPPEGELPPIGSGNKTVLDRESGRISHWPSYPVEALAHEYAAARDRLHTQPDNQVRRNIQLPPAPPGLATLEQLAGLQAPDGRRWLQHNALSDLVQQHHPLVVDWLAAQQLSRPGSLARGAERHAVLWLLSDALQDLDPQQLATCQLVTTPTCATCAEAAVHFGIASAAGLALFRQRPGELRFGSGTLPSGEPFDAAVWAELAFRMLEEGGDGIPRVEAARPVIERYPVAISDRSGPGRDVLIQPFRLAIHAGLRGHAGRLAGFGRLVGAAVFPLGEPDLFGVIAVDEHSRLFVLDEGGAWYCGRDIDTALRMLLEGENMPRVGSQGSLLI
ncbi:MAG TPA: SUKH-3 domain-containing protein [Candidatus Limnocylindrales bacterium]